MAGKNPRALRPIFVIAALLATAAAARAGGCEDLVNLKLADTTIKSAQAVPAGDFAATPKLTLHDMPAFCRVVAEVQDAPDSDILVEVWLPQENWKGVFHGTGNGGFAGTLAAGYGAMEAGLKRGYASATTDMGTAPSNDIYGDPLIGHPQKWKDWGMLSTHAMTLTGKAIAEAFYSAPAKRSYFTGCSTGGQQALIEAQYYPEDYDGILAGAPVINRTWGHALAIWTYAAANREPGHKLSDAKLKLVNAAAVKACGGKANGLAADPFIADALECKFDPGKLLCKAGDGDSCLTKGEVETVKAFYSGPLDQKGKPTYYGLLPGSELNGWSFVQTPLTPEPAFDGLFKWVFGADWNWRDFDFARDMPKVDAALGTALNGVTRGDLKAFQARGGKLVLFQGTADSLVAPAQTVDFYKRTAKEFGRETPDFARLFLAPGVGHCAGGQGPNAFNSALFARARPPSDDPGHDIFAAMTHWVEDGAAPARIVATKYADDTNAIAMQRPLCPYPQKAWYTGKGDTNDAGNFVCATKKPGR